MNKNGKCSENLLAINKEPKCMVFSYDEETGKNRCSQCQPYHYMDDEFKCHELPPNLTVGESPCIFGELSSVYEKIYCKICGGGFPSSMKFGNECIPFAEFRQEEEAEGDDGEKDKHFEYTQADVVSRRTENCLWGTFGSMGPECMRCVDGFVSVNGLCRKEKERIDKGCSWRGTSKFDEEGCGPCNTFLGYFAIGDGFCKQFYKNGVTEMVVKQESLVNQEKIHQIMDL